MYNKENKLSRNGEFFTRENKELLFKKNIILDNLDFEAADEFTQFNFFNQDSILLILNAYLEKIENSDITTFIASDCLIL